MIYCYRGWVRVVYEGQGEPFIMEAGDCVLQPPRIRHRVLESSPGLEVIEVSCPAEHETWTDHELALPTPAMEKTREFDGQRFVRHVASGAPWFPWRMGGFLARDTGIAEATGGLASVRVVHPDGGPSPSARHEADFLFLFVLRGAVKLSCEGHGSEPLSAGDSVVVPSGMLHGLEACSADLELLEVALPAGFRTLRAPE
jgi:mannose-6-phosphate isomerase-like protein (cupin superfamily)